MPRRPMKNEKANDFSGTIKKIFINMKKWKILVFIAVILAASVAIISLITPNKISDITDTITKGISPNTEKLEEIGKAISSNFKDKDKMMVKYQEIMMSENISLEDKTKFTEVMKNIDKKNNKMLELPDSVLEILFDDIKIDNVTIKKKDEIKTLKILSKMNTEDPEKALKNFDKLPKSVYNLIKPKMDLEAIKKVAIFLGILYLIGAIFGYLQNFILSTVSNRYAEKLRNDISVKINKLPLKFFDSHEMGDILSRITNDVDSISQHLNNSLAGLVSSITQFVGCTFMMFYTNWIMALTAIGSSIVGFIFMGLILSKSQKYFNKRQEELGNLNAHIEEIYSGHNIVKVYNASDDAKEEFDVLNNRLYTWNLKSQFLSGLMPVLMGFIGNFGYVCVCVVGAMLTMNNTISFGVIIAFMLYVRLFTSPLSQIAQGMTGLQSAAAAAERVFKFLEEKEMNIEENFKLKLDNNKVKGNIEFKNVNFGYDENKTIIKNFSVKVKNGEKIAIVGPTGAGKTTIVNLLMKFYEINDGDILIDGISSKELTRENIHNLFTMVLQDTWLFDGTIKENIIFNRKNVSDDEIWKVLKIVGIDHFVRSLPGGIDAKIGDNDTISQGQKQLLTIARAMIEDSPFLILDEATSNVDTRTEELVQKAMDKLTKGKTSFIIAHRLSTIKNADLILVMNEGNIIEQGNHDELMKKNGFYANLYNSQFEL